MSFAAPRIVVILSGGQGARMGGVDKGAVYLGERRLIDHVVGRLQDQVDEILISASHNYRTDLQHVPDRSDGPAGPASGLWSVVNWLKEYRPEAKSFFTVPVDTPFLPLDILSRLQDGPAGTIVETVSGPTPTIAHWPIEDLAQHLSYCATGEGVALWQIAKRLNVRREFILDEEALLNINCANDLEIANIRLATVE